MEQNINFKILNPGGNITALVVNNNYTDLQKKSINDKILKENNQVEQVGFISLKQHKLEMAGGEFCVNATRCAIWEYLKGKNGKIKMKVSGYPYEIIGGIKKDKEVYVNLPINKNIDKIISLKDEYMLVDLDGILIYVFNNYLSQKYIRDLEQNTESTKQSLKNIMKDFEINKNAIGVVLTEKENNGIRIYPIIWVRNINTLYYETACGSGSLAVALVTKMLKNLNELEIIQPSGYTIRIAINEKEGLIENAIISGIVLEN